MPADRHPKILVVDDAPQNVKLLRAILQSADYQVIEAGSGADALAKVHRDRPEAVILDVRMPGMSGYEVCERIRAEPSGVSLPVIMVTALSMPEERIRGIEAGATDFITKPFNKRELLARLETSLNQARGCSAELGTLALLFLDLDGRVLEATAPAASLLGTAAAQLRGKPVTELFAGPLPEEGVVRSASVSGRVNPLRDPAGRVMGRVLVLSPPAQ